MQRQFGFSLLMSIAFCVVMFASAPSVRAQSGQLIYDDALRNGWEDWGWATINYNNASPTHGGSASISVSATAWQALYAHHSAFATDSYDTLTFWIHGGASGGQRLQVQALLGGVEQPPVALAPLAANAWQQVTLSLSLLGAANKPNMDGIWIKDMTGTTQPTFYIDDMRLTSPAAPANVNLSVNAANVVRAVDNRMFAVNAAIWDGSFNTPDTISLLGAMDNKALRFPGGSLSDEYHWATNTTLNNTWTWATSFDSFANVARSTGAQAFITANYGSGSAQEAADWVRYSNVTKGYGFKYWEIGNENYGSWEYDTRVPAHDPYTYATISKDYIAQMKAVDPSIKIGVVVVTGEDSYANNTNHPATNPRTGQVHNGWTPVLLTTLKNLGVTPDYVIYHKYAQEPGRESDSGLLQSSEWWASDVANIRQMLTDYLGAAGSNVEIVCTENNSVSYNPGKQTTSLVNGLFLADSIGQALQTELKALVWWDLRNGQDTANNNDPALYGWRLYGDYGMLSSQNDRYPTYFVSKLLKFFARGGDSVVRATSDYNLLASYAAKRTDGTLSLLVINKSATSTLNASISLSGYTPNAAAIVYSYGIPQDEAARTGSGSPDVAQSSINNAATTFSYSFPAYSATVISLSAASTPTAPAAPGNLTASAISSSQISLAWADNSANEDGFRIERSIDGTNFTQVASVGANSTTYSDTSLNANTSYTYRVRAFNAAGNSAYSNTANATTLQTPPAAPTNLTASAASSSQINVAWTDASGNEDGFKIERCQGAGCTNFTEIAQTGANATGYSDTGRTGNTVYAYRVRAFNSSGNSAYSNRAEATTPAPPPTLPAAPGNLTVTAASTSQINLSWSDNSGNEDGFRIERCTGSGCTAFSQIATVGPGVRSYSNTGLSRNTSYTYRVRAYNAAGNSAYSNTSSARTLRK